MPRKPTTKTRATGEPEIRSTFNDGSGAFTGGYGVTGLAGTNVSPETAMTIAAVWNAVNIYANTIASLNLYVAERDPRGGRRPAYDHPVYDLVHIRPNRITTSFRYRQSAVANMLTHGNSYSEIEFDRGVPVALHLLDPRNVNPYIDDQGNLYYRLVREAKDLPARQILHFAGLGWDGIRGWSPIRLAANSLGLALAQQNYQSALMGNNATPNGYLEYPNALRDDQRQRLRDEWNKVHQGSEKTGNFAILSGGIKWVSTSFSPQDADLILSMNFSIAEIARLFLLPGHMLGAGAPNGDVEQQNLQFYMHSLQPLLTNMEQEMNCKLLSKEDYKSFFIRHDEKTLLRGNLTAQTAHDQALFSMGSKSINEIRLDDGLDPLDTPGADKHWIPVNNLTGIEDMDRSAVQPLKQVDPDVITEDPTQVAPMEVGPERLPPGALDALRSLVLDPVARMTRKECSAARSAAKKDNFGEWVETYYTRHAGMVAEAVGPALDAVNALTGSHLDPASLASTLAEASRARFNGLLTCVPPDELPDAVERACEALSGSAAEAVEEFMGGGE